MLNKLTEALTHKGEKKTLQAAFVVMLVFASIALIAAFTLSMEKIHLLQEPDAVLSRSINLVLNCAGVMNTWQSSVFFGIPNMYIGLVAFPVLIAVAVAALWGGAKYKKGFLVAMNIGVLLGTIFAYWLFYSSLYVIQILCPWCLIVTFSCTMLLAASTHISLRENAFGFKKAANEKVQKFLKGGYHQLIFASWIVLNIALVFIQFGMALFI